MSKMSTDRPVEIPSATLLIWLADLEDDYYNGGRTRTDKEEEYIEDLRRLLRQHEWVKMVPCE